MKIILSVLCLVRFINAFTFLFYLFFFAKKTKHYLKKHYQKKSETSQARLVLL
jgi:hypothetical protein